VVRNGDQEVNTPGYMVWLNYFRSIKHVCPWAYKSFIAGTTNIVPYDPEILVLSEINWGTEPWEVIIYLMGDDLTLDEIDKIVESRNNLQNKCEYLWSHPSFSKGGKNQTPVPVIIQQDRKRLIELRNASKTSKRRI
jgi:hypothetical protein